MRVLLIDDDRELGAAMQPVLAPYSIDLDLAYTPRDGLEKLSATPYDLLLLDVMLPDINGLEFCRQLRQKSQALARLPIIIVSARTELVDRVVGLETGADDYVTKPFEPRELVARIHALMRRVAVFDETSGNNATAPLAASRTLATQPDCRIALENDELLISNTSVTAAVNGTPVDLTAFEFSVLFALAERTGEVMSREELLSASSGADPLYADNLVSVIYRLRGKIRQAGAQADFIRTVRNRGYALVGDKKND